MLTSRGACEYVTWKANISPYFTAQPSKQREHCVNKHDSKYEFDGTGLSGMRNQSSEEYDNALTNL